MPTVPALAFVVYTSTRLYAQAKQEHKLPELKDFADQEHLDDCKIDLAFRQKQRLQFPGACSLVYQHLVQIIVKCLLQWDIKTKSGKPGVLGKVIAFARADEEQGRKTLHGHCKYGSKTLTSAARIFSIPTTTLGVMQGKNFGRTLITS